MKRKLLTVMFVCALVVTCFMTSKAESAKQSNEDVKSLSKQVMSFLWVYYE